MSSISETDDYFSGYEDELDGDVRSGLILGQLLEPIREGEESMLFGNEN